MTGRRERGVSLLVQGFLVTAGLAALAVPASAAATPFPTTRAALTAAAAAGDCDALVVDRAGMLGAGGGPLAAARALSAGHHATVRVRTYPSVPEGNLDRAVAAEVTRCASWHDRHGRKRADLVVLAVSLGDRRTGIYYGSGWTAALADRQEDVQTATVNPLLRRGEYVAAVSNGLAALGRLLPARPAGTTRAVEPAPGGSDAQGLSSDPALSGTQDPTGAPWARNGAAVAGTLVGAVVVGLVATTMIVGRALGLFGRRSTRWRSANGRALGSGLGAGSFGNSSTSFSGGSDAGSSSSSGSSDGGGSSTSW